MFGQNGCGGIEASSSPFSCRENEQRLLRTFWLKVNDGLEPMKLVFRPATAEQQNIPNFMA